MGSIVRVMVLKTIDPSDFILRMTIPCHSEAIAEESNDKIILEKKEHHNNGALFCKKY